MKGYVARKGNRYYAVIYEGTDPLTGRDRRRWYPAGTDKDAAEALTSDLADRHRRGGLERSSLTVAIYLTQRWLPPKKLALRPSTWDAYRRIINLHLIPRIGGSHCDTCAQITLNASTPTCSTQDGPTAPAGSTTKQWSRST
jgi:hypothetical protein